MLNAIGLQNVGAKALSERKTAFTCARSKTRVVVNVFAYSTEDYVRCIEILNEAKALRRMKLISPAPTRVVAASCMAAIRA